MPYASVADVEARSARVLTDRERIRAEQYVVDCTALINTVVLNPDAGVARAVCSQAVLRALTTSPGLTQETVGALSRNFANVWITSEEITALRSTPAKVAAGKAFSVTPSYPPVDTA